MSTETRVTPNNGAAAISAPDTRYTPAPDGPYPGPGPFPGPIPEPEPRPFPRPPEDWDRPIPLPPDEWWKLVGRRTCSGHYVGTKNGYFISTKELELRIDVDRRHANSPVMNKVSGDFFSRLPLIGPIRPNTRAFGIRKYIESWIVDNPSVTWSRSGVTITGDVRFWQGTHPATTVSIFVTTMFRVPKVAEVTFTTATSTAKYTCPFVSDTFRDMTLEVDVCASVNNAPMVPMYDTHAHDNRPADTPQRLLNIESSYREAGVGVTIRPNQAPIDDSDPAFTSWSVAELHDAMETYFSQNPGTWPKWQMWGMLATIFDNSGVGGIMFDAPAMYGGAGEAPDRQGFAVFRNHQWFDNLVANPTNQDEAWAMRHFLYTWVHEAGHAFNFLHSWNKNREDSLSWMNYDWKYDSQGGHSPGDFWAGFEFRFDDEELIHMRHGDRKSVIMGGDDWASGGHLETGPNLSQFEGEAPLEVLVRSNGFLDFMEPVQIEVRLRNTLPVPQVVDVRLEPEFELVQVYIKKPSGEVVQYHPVTTMCGSAQLLNLSPKDTKDGTDRFSKQIDITFGAGKFLFDTPGDYIVRVVYQDALGIGYTSDSHKLRVGMPFTREEDKFAQDYFSQQVGLSLYFNGTMADRMKKGMDVLRYAADRDSGSLRGAKVAAVVASAECRSFHTVIDRKLKMTHKPDPATAIKQTDAAIKLLSKMDEPTVNLLHHQVARDRAECLVTMGEVAAAKKEIDHLGATLEKRGVHSSVLNQVKALKSSL